MYENNNDGIETCLETLGFIRKWNGVELMSDFFEIVRETHSCVLIETVEEIYGRKFSPDEIVILKQNVEDLFPEVDVLYQLDVDRHFTDDEQVREDINWVLFNINHDWYSVYDEDGNCIKNTKPQPPPIEHDWF